MSEALRARIVINSLNSAGVTGFSMRQKIMTAFMADSAAATGGHYIEQSNNLAGGFNKLVSLPEVSFLLGFSPDEEPDGKYHRLTVKVKNAQGNRVESREGYYAAPLTGQSETAQQRLDREVVSKDQLEEIPATVHVSLGPAKDGEYSITVGIQMDAKRLKFARQGGRHVEEITFATVLEDAAGNYITGKLSVMDLALTDATLADFGRKGIKAAVSFRAPKGAYQIREVMREAAENHLASSTTPFSVR